MSGDSGATSRGGPSRVRFGGGHRPLGPLGGESDGGGGGGTVGGRRWDVWAWPRGDRRGEKSAAGAGRGRPESGGRSPSQLAQQGAERGVGGVAPRGVGRRRGGGRRDGGFGPLAGGVQV